MCLAWCVLLLLCVVCVGVWVCVVCVLFLTYCVMLYGLVVVCVGACIVFLMSVRFVGELLCDGLWCVVCAVLDACVRVCFVGLDV